MILGMGVDILEVGRMERALKQAGFKEKTFTRDEIEYCESKGAHSSLRPRKPWARPWAPA